MTRVQKGNDFLTSISLDELKKIYKIENNAKAKIRLQACIMRKQGKTLEEISDKVSYPLTTVGDWLRRIHDKGIERRYSIKQSGRPSNLKKNQKEELKGILEESPEKQGLPFRIWTAKLLAYFIEQRYKVAYKIRRVEKLVHELGFNFKKPRQEHRDANKKLQEAFKKTSVEKLSHISKMDGRSYFLMKASLK